jgi:hypothetical protein
MLYNRLEALGGSIRNIVLAENDTASGVRHGVEASAIWHTFQPAEDAACAVANRLDDAGRLCPVESFKEVGEFSR